MRPNYAMDAPPDFIEVRGFRYPCKTDYRVWLDVLDKLKSIDLNITDEASLLSATNRILEIESILFDGWLRDENPLDVLKAISEFSKGYPSAPNTAPVKEPLFSFNYDLNEIIIAIRNQSGIDLSYKRQEPFHWWEFLLEVRTLSGDHYILNLMDIRGYKGKDSKLLRKKQEYALPTEFTEADLAEYEAFSNMFEEDAIDED